MINNFYDNYIVVLKNPKDKIRFEKFLKYRYIKYIALNELNMYIVNALESESTIIKNLNYIEAIVIDIDIETEINNEESGMCPIDTCNAQGNVYANWGIESMHIGCLWRQRLTGLNMNIGVIDTGIANHNYLKVTKSVTFVPDEDPIDQNGHGTRVAGVIASTRYKPGPNCTSSIGICYACNLFNIKAFNKNGVGKFIGIISSLNWCLENKINVACLGVSFKNNLETINIDYLGIMYRAIKEATDKGLIIVSITGTDGTRNVKQPGNIKPVLAIGYVDTNLLRGNLSNYGPGINYVAPGQYILSTSLNNKYEFSTGSSLAAAQVTGLITLLLQQDKSRKQQEIQKILTENALPVGTPGYDFEYGQGIVDSPCPR